MSQALTLQSSIGDIGSYQKTNALGTVITQPISLAARYKMVYGASASDANDTVVVPTKYYENLITITVASAIHEIDLTQLMDDEGNILNFSKIYRLVFHNNDATTGTGIKVGPGGGSPWVAPFKAGATTADFVLVDAGGDFVISSPYKGYNVTSGSKILRFTNDASSPTGAGSGNLHIFGS